MNDSSRGCSIAVGSVTQAMKAQKILASAAIPSIVIKYDAQGASRGCVYGLSFSCLQTDNARTVLSGAGLKVKQWNVQS